MGGAYILAYVLSYIPALLKVSKLIATYDKYHNN